MRKLADKVGKIDKKMVLIVLVLTVLAMTPLLFQGIICNDELQTRFLRSLGMSALIRDNISTAAAKGRTLGGYVDVRELSFISNNMYLNRLVDILLILAAIGLFVYFVYSINGNLHFACFVGLMLMVCLPVTFEHGAPNAFVAITVVPLMLATASMLLFWRYLNGKRKWNLWVSMLMYLIAMMQYEFVITYVLLMYLLILKRQRREGKINWPETIRKAAVPTLVSFSYIAVYFGMQRVHSSGYAGNTIGFESAGSSLKIIYVLAKSAVPGYFLFNDKYRYYRTIFAEQSESGLYLNIIIFLIVLLLVGVFFFLFSKSRGRFGKWNWGEIAVAAMFMVIPSLPNSISSMYQGTVTEHFFTWLPVSICLYFSAVFLMCSLLWNLVKHGNRFILAAGTVLISCYAGQIQQMNYLIASQQHRDFTRLQTIEGLFDMQFWADFEGEEVYSRDIYETRNLLAVHDGFWTGYCLGRNGRDIEVVNGETEAGLSLYFINESYFVLSDRKTLLVCAPRAMEGYHEVKVSEDHYVCVEFGEGIPDSGYYIYCFGLDEREVGKISYEDAVEGMAAN